MAGGSASLGFARGFAQAFEQHREQQRQQEAEKEKQFSGLLTRLIDHPGMPVGGRNAALQAFIAYSSSPKRWNDKQKNEALTNVFSATDRPNPQFDQYNQQLQDVEQIKARTPEMLQGVVDSAEPMGISAVGQAPPSGFKAPMELAMGQMRNAMMGRQEIDRRIDATQPVGAPPPARLSGFLTPEEIAEAKQMQQPDRMVVMPDGQMVHEKVVPYLTSQERLKTTVDQNELRRQHERELAELNWQNRFDSQQRSIQAGIDKQVQDMKYGMELHDRKAETQRVLAELRYMLKDLPASMQRSINEESPQIIALGNVLREMSMPENRKEAEDVFGFFRGSNWMSNLRSSHNPLIPDSFKYSAKQANWVSTIKESMARKFHEIYGASFTGGEQQMSRGWANDTNVPFHIWQARALAAHSRYINKMIIDAEVYREHPNKFKPLSEYVEQISGMPYDKAREMYLRPEFQTLQAAAKHFGAEGVYGQPQATNPGGQRGGFARTAPPPAPNASPNAQSSLGIDWSFLDEDMALTPPPAPPRR